MQNKKNLLGDTVSTVHQRVCAVFVSPTLAILVPSQDSREQKLLFTYFCLKQVVS